MPLLPQWCSLCRLCHRWLWRHRYPVLQRSLSRHQPTACTCQRGELRYIYKAPWSADRRPTATVLPFNLCCLNNRCSAQLRRGHLSWIERVNLLGGQLGIQSLQDSSWLSKWSYTTFCFITLCLSKCCTSCLPLCLLNSAAWGTAGWRTQRCC